jgi:hypothetical protein
MEHRAFLIVGGESKLSYCFAKKEPWVKLHLLYKREDTIE